jgi:hypothetical protein
MKFVPVVEIVQIHRVFGSGSIVRNSARAQHTLARVAIVDISAHGGVMLLDGLRVKRFGVFLYPRFELGVVRLALLDVILYRLFIEPKRSTGHRIEASADARIAGREFAPRFERDFLPEAREVQNAEWAGHAGADQWNVGFAHISDVF